MDTYSVPVSEAGDSVEHFDVLIVGAGLSGIGAAWHLQDRCPGRSYAILEGREASGGTWDLFRYPGVRSDSDMYTLGYRFRPWEGAKHVTMLQRSPTYMAVRPSKDPFATKMRRRLPLKLAYMVTRWKNVLLGMYFYQMCKRKPERVKELLLGYVRQFLGPDYDIGTHFTPRYNPWDQRLCLLPDSDFFRGIRQGKVSVVTDHIETFTESGIRLKSGQELEADLIVTATGLVLVPLGGAKLTVD